MNKQQIFILKLYIKIGHYILEAIFFLQKGSRVLHLHQGDRTKALGHRVGRQGNQGYGVCFRDNDRYVKKIDIWIQCKKKS